MSKEIDKKPVLPPKAKQLEMEIIEIPDDHNEKVTLIGTSAIVEPINYETVSCCGCSCHFEIVDNNYLEFDSRGLSRRNLMLYDKNEPSKFIVCPDCRSAGCLNPSRSLKYPNIKCQELSFLRVIQIRHLEKQICKDIGLPFQTFMDLELKQFKLYIKSRSVDTNDFQFYNKELEGKSDTPLSERTRKLVFNYVLRRTMEELFPFQRDLNINEFFIVLSTELLRKIGFNDLRLFVDGVRSTDNFEITNLLQMHSWGSSKGKKNPLFTSNLAKEIILLCTDWRGAVYNKKSLFDNNYLPLKDFVKDVEVEEQLYLSQLAGTEDEEKQIQNNPYTFYKFCQFLKLEVRRVWDFNTLDFCFSPIQSGAMSGDVKRLQKFVNSDLPRMFLQEPMEANALFGRDIFEEYRIIRNFFMKKSIMSAIKGAQNANKSRANEVQLAQHLSETRQEMKKKLNQLYPTAPNDQQENGPAQPVKMVALPSTSRKRLNRLIPYSLLNKQK